jgi:hypothetical protein
MTCDFVQMPGGGTAVICSHTRRRRCSVCGELRASKLCDGPPAPGSRNKTCDVDLCTRCAVHVDGKDVDFCPRHAPGAQPKEEPMRHRGGPTQHVSGLLPLAIPSDPAAVEALARARANLAASGGRPGELADLPPSGPPEPRPTFPDAGDVQRTNNEEVRHAPVAGKAGQPPQPGAGDVPPAPAAPRHQPRVCSSCSAPILWAQVLDDAGQRVRRGDDKGWKSMPVDFQPDPLKGNVVLFDRPGEGIVCRVLKKGEAPPPGARLRTSHFATCPNANQHRRTR